MSGYWAAEGRISRAPVEGGVEISAEAYADARAAMIAGQEVTVIGGEMVVRGRQPSPAHEWMEGEWVDTTPEPPAPTPEQIIDAYRLAIQAHVDAAAQGRDYNDGNALAGYIASTVPQWAAEALAFVAWRDEVWAYAYTELAKVTTEPPEREVPSIENFIGELPAIEWPQQEG